MTTSRIRDKALEVLRAGRALSPPELSALVPCTPTSAGRTLKAMHDSGKRSIRIAAYRRNRGRPSPVYELGTAPSVSPAKARTGDERTKKYRASAKFRAPIEARIALRTAECNCKMRKTLAAKAGIGGGFSEVVRLLEGAAHSDGPA